MSEPIYQYAQIPPSPPSIDLPNNFDSSSRPPSNKSFHSLASSANSVTSRAHAQIASLPIKDRPLDQILTKPYGEVLPQSEDDPSVVSFQVDPNILKDAPRSFDRLNVQPWVPSLHSPIESNISVTSGGTNASANSLAAITNAAISGSEPSSLQVRTVSPTPFGGSVITSPAVMFPPSIQTSYFTTSTRDRVSNLKGRTGSMSSSSGESEKSKIIPEIQRTAASANASVTKLPQSSTISINNNHNFAIEEEDSSSSASVKQTMVPPLPSNISLSNAASISASASVLNGTNGNLTAASFFFDVAAPPLAFYRHIPRIFGVEPPYISGHTCTLVNNKLFIFGGRTPTGHSNKLYIFNCTTNLLTCPNIHGQIPPPIRDVTATLTEDNNLIYYFGGQDETKFYNSIYVLDTRSYKFTKLSVEGKIPEPRAGHSTVLRKCVKFFDDISTVGSTASTNSLNKKPITISTLYIFGGASNSDVTFNDVWKLHISPANPYEVKFSEISFKDNWPSPRVNHTAHSYKDGMLVYGGNDSSNRVFKTLWLFDFASETWNTINDSSRPRTLHMSELVGDQLIVIGGHDGEKCIVFVDIYNLKSGAWHSRLCNGMQSSGQCFHKGVYYDSRTFIVGGLDPIHILSGLRIIEMPNIKL